MKIKQTLLDFIRFVKNYDTKFTFRYSCITAIILQLCFIFAYNHWINPDWNIIKHIIIKGVNTFCYILKHLNFILASKVLWANIVGFFEMQIHVIAISFWIWVLIPMRYYFLYRKFKVKPQQTEVKIKQQNTQQTSKHVSIPQQLKEAPRRGKSTLG